jgi:hypothetical protein
LAQRGLHRLNTVRLGGREIVLLGYVAIQIVQFARAGFKELDQFLLDKRTIAGGPSIGRVGLELNA